MKFRCVKKNLEIILKEAEPFIGKDLDLPVLSGILLKAENGYLNISATNVDSTFYAEIPISLEEEGQTVVFGDVFYKTISGIKDDDIEIFLENNLLFIKSKNNQSEINILDYKDFPSILKLEEQDEEQLQEKITISNKDLENGLNSVSYSASKSNIKPELSSVFINKKDDGIYFVATDGFRLAEKKIKHELEESEFSALIPNSFIAQILKVLSITIADALELYFYENQLFIKAKEFTISSRLVIGDYVDYKRLLPEDTNTSVILLKQDFIDATKLINIFSDDFNQVTIVVDPEEKRFEIFSKNKIGKNKINIPSVIAGESVRMDFNYKFIQDSLQSITTDSIEFIFNKSKPLLIKPVGDKSFNYIIMPLSK